MTTFSYRSALKKLADKVNGIILENNKTRNEQPTSDNLRTGCVEWMTIWGHAATLAALFDKNVFEVDKDLRALITVERNTKTS